MADTTYTPHPIDTSAVQLSEDILELTEKLAENTHEVWAAERMAQGWTYGPQRNDPEKKHPCLVKYDNLSDDEKVYDRNTTLEALKCVIQLGYKIEKVEE